jgi:hypothetical protein
MIKSNIIFAIGFCFSQLVFGGQDRGGDIMRPFTPSEPFEYKCQAQLEQPQPQLPNQEITETFSYISKQDFILNNQNASTPALILPEEKWKHFKQFNDRESTIQEVPASMIIYPLKGHFTAMSFITNGKVTVASLRANIVLGSTGTSGWASADFASKTMSERIDTIIPSSGEPITMSINCTRAK